MWSTTVKSIRHQMNLTQEGLGDILNVSTVTISRWENGRDQPSQTHQKRLQELSAEPIISLEAVSYFMENMTQVSNLRTATGSIIQLAFNNPNDYSVWETGRDTTSWLTYYPELGEAVSSAYKTKCLDEVSRVEVCMVDPVNGVHPYTDKWFQIPGIGRTKMSFINTLKAPPGDFDIGYADPKTGAFITDWR